MEEKKQAAENIGQAVGSLVGLCLFVTAVITGLAGLVGAVYYLH